MSGPKVKLSIEKTYELRAAHLGMIQEIIARVADNGATLKSYCVALVTAVCGLAVTLQKTEVVLLSLLPIAAFAVVDALYLRTERRLRALYDMERLEDWAAVPTFEITLSKAPAKSFWSALSSWSVLAFYLPLALGIGATFLFFWS